MNERIDKHYYNDGNSFFTVWNEEALFWEWHVEDSTAWGLAISEKDAIDQARYYAENALEIESEGYE